MSRTPLITTILVAGATLTSSAYAEDLFRDHGVAAPVSECRGAIATADTHGNPIILAMALDAGASLLVIDARTGATEQFWYPDKGAISGPNYCLMVASTGRFYVMMGDVFLEFDADSREWTFAEGMRLGTAMSLTEGPDGTIYAGTYPESHLLAFDPDRRELTHLGQLDGAEKYPFSLAADDSGWVYAGVGTARANLVAFHPETGVRRQLVEDSERKTGSGKVHKGRDGEVYGQLPGGSWLKLANGEAEAVPEPGPRAVRRAMNWGGIYRAFPGGGSLDRFDLPGKSFTVTDADGGETRHAFDYVSTGASITSMVAGTDGRIYGSTCHPFRLFVCDPTDGGVVNLGGLNAVGGGNWCGLASVGTTIYGAEYAGGRLYAYDTTTPWRDSEDATANPSVVAQYKAAICRPRTALAHPDGRHVLFAGFPGYGRVGGGLGIYEIETGEASLLANEDILPGESTITMRALPDGNLVAGTSIDAPGGAEPVAESGSLFIMDWPRRHVTFQTRPVPEARGVSCVDVGADGLVYGIANTSVLFIFDPAAQRIVHTVDLSEHGRPMRPDQSLLTRPDGRMLLLLSESMLEIAPESFTARRIAALPSPASAGLALHGGHVYYASGSRVWSCRISSLPH